ncbi:MAG: HD domain-containing phosphohydrolase [Desulfobacteraceae bacterium]|jgi:HD-GYP domain-containing protein (c-di-GMP phosphodiesterase class II)
MVRFSDIIKDGEQKEPSKKSPENRAEDEDLNLSDSQISRVMSDTQILKVRGEKASSDPSFREEWSPEVITYYESFIERAIDIRSRVRNEQGISPSPILSDLHHILNKDLVDKLYEYAMFAPIDIEWLLVHNVRMTFISLILGQGLGYDIKMLLKLGLAALLENVGMYKIPDTVLEKKGSLDDNEMAMIREHPKKSYEVLDQMGERYRWLAEVALQVHERTDGSGYPYGLKGGEIYELSSVIGLTDMYVAMTSDRPYRNRIVQTDAIKHVVEEAKEEFPANIRKVFLNRISLFPVNTYVMLNNKSIGRVISTEKEQPLRPTIELLYDSDGGKLEKREVVKLSENPLLYITESIHKRDLP